MSTPADISHIDLRDRQDPHASAVVKPSRGWGFPSFSELWAYRDLVYFLARRDVAARYKQTAVGALWALLQPLGMSQVRGFVRSPSEWSVEQLEGQMRPVISSREHFA